MESPTAAWLPLVGRVGALRAPEWAAGRHGIAVEYVKLWEWGSNSATCCVQNWSSPVEASGVVRSPVELHWVSSCISLALLFHCHVAFLKSSFCILRSVCCVLPRSAFIWFYFVSFIYILFYFSCSLLLSFLFDFIAFALAVVALVFL